MKRRECLTILGAVIAGPLIARTQRPLLHGDGPIDLGADGSAPTGMLSGVGTGGGRRLNAVEYDGATDHLEHTDMSGHADSKTGMSTIWFSNGEYFDLSTAEGRAAALYATRRNSRWA